MNLINPPTHALGLQISDLSIKAAELERRGGKIKLKTLAGAKLPAGWVKDGQILDITKLSLAIREMIKRANPGFTAKYAVLSLPETKTFIKVIEVPNKPEPASRLISQELPKHIPVNLEEMRASWQEIPSDKPSAKIRKFLVGLAPKKTADDYAKAAKLSGLEPVALEIESQAMARGLNPVQTRPKIGWWAKLLHRPPDEESAINLKQSKIILNLGASAASLILLDRGIIQFTSKLDFSGESINQVIADRLKLDAKKAEKIKIICGANPKKCKGEVVKIIEERIEALAREITNAINFCQTHFSDNGRELAIIIIGGGANLLNIDKNLEKLTSIKTVLGETNIDLGYSPLIKNKNDSLAYLTVMGLGCRYLQ